MNKTVNINLAGRFFHIDETAYRTLETYLKKLKRAFSETEGSSEIIEDIEARMAELFEERKANPQAVISQKDVDEVIAILGEPVDFQETEESSDSQSTVKKKLFRDPEDRYIGGVAAGLGRYFGFEIFWIRLIWLLLFLFSGGTFLFLYILFWILLPAAHTTTEKLQMKGEPVNISTIEKKIKEEFEEVSQKVKDVDFKKGSETLKKKSRSTVDGLGKVLSGLLKFAGLFVGVLLIIIGFNMLAGLFIGLLGTLLLGWTLGPFLVLQSLISTVIPIWGLFLLAFIIALVPALFIFALGLKMVRPQKSIFSPVFVWSSVLIWFASILVLSGVGFNQIRKNRVESSITEATILPLQVSDTLRLQLQSNRQDYERIVDWGNPFELYENEAGDRVFLSDDWRLVIEPTTASKAELSTHFSSRGGNIAQAKKNAKDILFEPVVEDSRVLFPSHWIRLAGNTYHDRDLRTYLHLPEGQKVFIHSKLSDHMSWETPHNENLTRRELAGHLFEMTIDGLKCLDCPPGTTTREFHYRNSKNGTEIRIRKQ